MLLAVVEILDHLLEHHTVDFFEMANTGGSFAKVACWFMVSDKDLELRSRAFDILDGSSMRRMVPEMQAAERRTWNSKPSEDTRVT
jgi:hypothetical protein